jgi:hypothetical protein
MSRPCLILILLLLFVHANRINGEEVLSEEEHKKICRTTLLDVDSNLWYTDMMTSRKPECKSSSSSTTDDINDDKKLLIVSPHTNAFLIKVQKHSLDLFINEPFEYIVYDDSIPYEHFTNWKTNGISNIIKHTTLDHGGTYKNVSESFHLDRRCLFPNTLEPFINNANTRCSDIYQYILRDKAIYCHNGIVLFLDADVILTKPFKPSIYMSSNSHHKSFHPDNDNKNSQVLTPNIISVPQIRKYIDINGNSGEISYMWTALNIMNMPILRNNYGLYDMNWDCGQITSNYENNIIFNNTLKLDSGGHTYDWLIKHKVNIEWYSIDDIYQLGDMDQSNEHSSPIWKWFSQEWQNIYKKNSLYDLEFKSQLLGGLFLHLRNAGNWMSHGKRYKWIQPDQVHILMNLLNKRHEEFQSTNTS